MKLFSIKIVLCLSKYTYIAHDNYTLLTKILLSIISCINVLTGFSTVCSSAGDGDWTNTATWSCGQVPGCGDTIVINNGDVVTITTQLDLTDCPNATLVFIEGDLAFTNGNKLLLNCNPDTQLTISPSGIVYKDGAGGGNSTLIEECGTQIWSAGDGDFNGPYNWGGGLPIELLNFNAQLRNGNVLLTWATASEVNNDFFTIQRSKNGWDFSDLEQVDGAGNSNSLLNYNTIDENPIFGMSYYRLKQTDNDGSFSYSDIKSVEYIEPDFIVFPNPAEQYDELTVERDQFTIIGEDLQNYNIDVKTIDGKIVNVGIVKEEHKVVLNSLSTTGVFFIHLKNENQSYNIRVVVQ